MKILVIILISISFSGNFIHTYSWDTAAAKYYPLAVGNSWSYSHGNFAQFTCVPYTYYNFIVSIDSLVYRPNGKQYYKFSNGVLRRIDSVSMNVYTYNGSGECLFDSLLARKNDTMRVCPFNISFITDTSMVTFLGEQRKTKKNQKFIIGNFHHILMYGLGFYYEIACEGGGYSRILNGAIINGVLYGELLGLISSNENFPQSFSLSQNYPNPFNPVTKIKFAISGTTAAQTFLSVFDVLGHEVAVLVNQQLQPGTYEADWDAAAYPSGVYYYKLEAGNFTESKRMVLIK